MVCGVSVVRSKLRSKNQHRERAGPVSGPCVQVLATLPRPVMEHLLVYHDPVCSKSRGALEILRARGMLERAIVAQQGKVWMLAPALGKDRKGLFSMACYALAIPLAFVRPLLVGALYVLVGDHVVRPRSADHVARRGMTERRHGYHPDPPRLRPGRRC